MHTCLLICCWLEFLNELHCHTIGHTISEQHPSKHKCTATLGQERNTKKIFRKDVLWKLWNIHSTFQLERRCKWGRWPLVWTLLLQPAVWECKYYPGPSWTERCGHRWDPWSKTKFYIHGETQTKVWNRKRTILGTLLCYYFVADITCANCMCVCTRVCVWERH